MGHKSKKFLKNNLKLFLSVRILCCLLIISMVLVGCGSSLEVDNVDYDKDITSLEVDNVDYDKDITSNEVILYYSSAVSDSEAQDLLAYLAEEDPGEYDCFLNKNENGYEISFVVVKNKDEIDDKMLDEIILQYQIWSGSILKDVFNGAKVNTNLYDSDLNILHTIPSTDVILNVKTDGAVIVYYKNNVSQVEAENLLKYFIDQEFDEFDALLSKNEEGYEVSIQSEIYRGDLDQELMLEVQIWSFGISNEVFNGANVNVNLCDEDMSVLHTISSSEIIQEKEFNGSTICYGPAISERQIDFIGNYLVELGCFNEEEWGMTIYQDEEDAYRLCFVVAEDIEDEELIQLFKDTCKELSKVIFNDEKVYIELVNEDNETFREITY